MFSSIRESLIMAFDRNRQPIDPLEEKLLQPNGFSPIKISKISKRLLVPEKKLMEKNENGELKEYIRKKISKYGKILSKSVDDYQKISNNYERIQEDILRNKDFSLSEELLMKIVRKSNLALKNHLKVLNGDQNEFVSVSLKNNPDLKIYAQRNKGQLFIFNKESIPLGSGAFGTVEKVSLLSKGKFAALKIAKNKSYPLTKEYQNLKAIQCNDKKECIQKAPYSLGTLEGKSAYLAPLYLDNAKNIKLPTNKNKLDVCKQMIIALITLEENSIIHGDIKPANFLVKNGKNGEMKLALADFGDVLSYKNKNINLKFGKYKGTSCTKGFYTKEDDFYLINEGRQGNSGIWIKLNHSRDMFALASSIWYILTGSCPFSFDNESYPLIKGKAKNLDKIKEILSEDAVNILLRVLKSPPLERPSVAELYQNFKGLEEIEEIVDQDKENNEFYTCIEGSFNDDPFDEFDMDKCDITSKKMEESSKFNSFKNDSHNQGNLDSINFDLIPEIPCEFNDLEHVDYM